MMLLSILWLLLPAQAWALDSGGGLEYHLAQAPTRGITHFPRATNLNATFSGPLPDPLASATAEEIQRARVLVAKVDAMQAKCKEVSEPLCGKLFYNAIPGVGVNAVSHKY